MEVRLKEIFQRLKLIQRNRKLMKNKASANKNLNKMRRIMMRMTKKIIIVTILIMRNLQFPNIIRLIFWEILLNSLK